MLMQVVRDKNFWSKVRNDEAYQSAIDLIEEIYKQKRRKKYRS